MSDAPRPRRGSGVGAALTAPFRGLGVLASNPGLWPLAAVPCAIALALLIGLYAAAWHGWDWVTSFLATPPAGDEWGVWWKVAKGLTGLALLVAVPVTSALLAPAVAEPFLGKLARAVRQRVTGVAPTPPSGLYADWIAPLWHLSLRLGFLLLVHVLMLPLLAVPLAGPLLYATVGWGFTAFVLGLLYLDYPLDTAPRLLPPRVRRAYFWSHWPAGFALGIVVSFVALVPCLSFILLPVLVSGATLLYLDLGGDDSLPPPPAPAPPPPRSS